VVIFRYLVHRRVLTVPSLLFASIVLALFVSLAGNAPWFAAQPPRRVGARWRSYEARTCRKGRAASRAGREANSKPIRAL